MKVTYNWLKDFVDIRIPARALAEKLTMAGLEVTSLEEREGDFVLEIEVTSNRPDWLSVIGIAREVAAITNSKLKSSISHCSSSIAKGAQGLAIKIESKKDCPLYTAKIIRGVSVGPSPEWLKGRLELVGCRSVNNVVDITNYILFAYGEPMHAFDLDKLSGNTIMVRRAKANEKLTTLDAAEIALGEDILIIADEEKPVAIAGIMGGENSEVTYDTKNILLEAAVFNPIVVRRARQKLGLMSESSYRFERGVDLETAQNASWQAVELIQQLCAGKCVLAKSAGKTQSQKKNIRLDLSNTRKILGLDIASGKIKGMLARLEFKVRPQGKNNLAVSVPAHRQDVNLEIDLVEEIARIYGYERIPASSPKVSPDVTISGTRSLVSLVKNILVGLGLNEVISYSLIDRNRLRGMSVDFEPIGILNPLSQEQEVLRPTVIPGLLNCIAINLNQKQNYINIFEIAKAFSGLADKPKEELVLGLGLCGAKATFIGEQGVIREEVGLMHLKGALEVLFSRLGISNRSFEASLLPTEFEVYIGKDKIGKIAKIAKTVLEGFGIKNKDVVVAEVNLEKILPQVRLEKKFLPPAIYPAIARDISLILKEEIRADDILKAVKERGGALLEEARIADYYKGKQIPPGFKGLTISCVYRSGQRTLTEAEVNPAHSLVSAVLKDRFGAQIR